MRTIYRRSAFNKFCKTCGDEFFTKGWKQNHCSELCYFSDYTKILIPGDADSCWEWQGVLNPVTKHAMSSFKNDNLGAYRRSYRLFVGDLDEREVCHKCNHPWCVNPNHLELGSHEDNMNFMAKSKRSMFGDKHKDASVSNESALAIFESNDDNKTLALRYGIHPRTVNNIKIGRYWNQVTGMPKYQKKMSYNRKRL